MSWFQIPGYDKITLSATGCGPGAPLADIMYNVAMIPVMKEFTSTLVENNLHPTWPAQQKSPFWQICKDTRHSELFESRQHSVSTAYVDDFSALTELDISIESNILSNIKVILLLYPIS